MTNNLTVVIDSDTDPKIRRMLDKVFDWIDVSYCVDDRHKVPGKLQIFLRVKRRGQYFICEGLGCLKLIFKKRRLMRELGLG